MGAIVTRPRTYTHTRTHTHTEATRAEENESIRGMGARQRCCAHLGFPTRCLALPWVGNMAGCPSATNTYHCKADMCGSCDCVGEIRIRHGPYTTPSWIKLWCGNLPWKMIIVLLYVLSARSSAEGCVYSYGVDEVGPRSSDGFGRKWCL